MKTIITNVNSSYHSPTQRPVQSSKGNFIYLREKMMCSDTSGYCNRDLALHALTKIRFQTKLSNRIKNKKCKHMHSQKIEDR